MNKLVKQWNDWRKAEKYKTYVDLTGIDLSDRELIGIDFSFCTLNNARFDNAQLNNACLNYSRLNNVRLNNAHLKGADFNYAEFNYINLNRAQFYDIQDCALNNEIKIMSGKHNLYTVTISKIDNCGKKMFTDYLILSDCVGQAINEVQRHEPLYEIIIENVKLFSSEVYIANEGLKP